MVLGYFRVLFKEYVFLKNKLEAWGRHSRNYIVICQVINGWVSPYILDGTDISIMVGS